MIKLKIEKDYIMGTGGNVNVHCFDIADDDNLRMIGVTDDVICGYNARFTDNHIEEFTEENELWAIYPHDEDELRKFAKLLPNEVAVPVLQQWCGMYAAALQRIVDSASELLNN
ncbi:hypothetical protein D3C75_333160 [compost metagenome]